MLLKVTKIASVTNNMFMTELVNVIQSVRAHNTKTNKEVAKVVYKVHWLNQLLTQKSVSVNCLILHFLNNQELVLAILATFSIR